MKMRAEKFIELIEQGRYDKVSKNAMNLIAERFRELQSEKLTLTDVGCSYFTENTESKECKTCEGNGITWHKKSE